MNWGRRSVKVFLIDMGKLLKRPTLIRELTIEQRLDGYFILSRVTCNNKNSGWDQLNAAPIKYLQDARKELTQLSVNNNLVDIVKII